MVALNARHVKRVPSGTIVRFMADIPELDIVKGDEATIISRTIRQRGIGSGKQYFAVFDDGTEVIVDPNTFVRIVEEAPEVREKRGRFWSALKGRTKSGAASLYRSATAPPPTYDDPPSSQVVFPEPSEPKYSPPRSRRYEPVTPIKKATPKDPEDSDEDFWLGSPGKVSKEEGDFWGTGEWKDPLA